MMLDALRIANVVLWSLLGAYMLPGAFSAGTGKGTRHGDPMRLSVLLTALLFVAGNLRLLLAPNNIWLWEAISAACAVDAVYIAILARTYGRGKRLD